MDFSFVLSQVKGYRTHMAVISCVLCCFATACGMFPSTTGQALAIAAGGVAVSFSRFATSDLSNKIDAALQALPGPAFQETATEQRLQRLFTSQNTPPGPLAMLLFALVFLFAGEASAQTPAVLSQMHLNAEARGWFRNPPDFGGSCVQASIGMLGVQHGDLNAATLLWDSQYGKAERGGSWPSRVEEYCNRRGIRAMSVTGESVDETWPWIEWSVRTGRFCAFGAGTAHFQTVWGYDPTDRKWLVCNNNTPNRIDRYDERQIRELHRQSGPWVVILDSAPSSAAPVLTAWWK